ncbi:MAG TPA: 16S rRNA (cytosine(1402)-N(4))-methyltransferase RsmH [Cyclobacteriaceae bacterium]
MSEPNPYHRPVMLQESVAALRVDPEGVYVDATFGGGGHSMAILEVLKGGMLIAFDQDEEAKEQAERVASRSFKFCHANFRYMRQYLKVNGITAVNGILADLGVSSRQIDSAARGFSTRLDGPLDMRMNQRQSLTAAQVLNTYSVDDLHRILGMYGEIRNARTAAGAIARARTKGSFERTSDLTSVLRPLAPRGRENKYFAQVFQALRIEVNEELKALEDFLHQCGETIMSGGRLVVISYHSLEDRMVKNYMNTGKAFGALDKDVYGNPIRPFVSVTRKAVTPSANELAQNSRARSARMRVAERV